MVNSIQDAPVQVCTASQTCLQGALQLLLSTFKPSHSHRHLQFANSCKPGDHTLFLLLAKLCKNFRKASNLREVSAHGNGEQEQGTPINFGLILSITAAFLRKIFLTIICLVSFELWLKEFDIQEIRTDRIDLLHEKAAPIRQFRVPRPRLGVIANKPGLQLIERDDWIPLQCLKACQILITGIFEELHELWIVKLLVDLSQWWHNLFLFHLSCYVIRLVCQWICKRLSSAVSLSIDPLTRFGSVADPLNLQVPESSDVRSAVLVGLVSLVTLVRQSHENLVLLDKDFFL